MIFCVCPKMDQFVPYSSEDVCNAMHVVASIISSCIMFTSTTLLHRIVSVQGTGRLRPTCQKTSHSKLSDFCRPKRPVTCVCRIFPKAKELYSYYRVQSGAPLKSVYKHTHKAFTEWTVFLFRRREMGFFFALAMLQYWRSLVSALFCHRVTWYNPPLSPLLLI